MDPLAILALIAGLVMLALGADFLVHGAVCLARRLGIPLLIIGLTVVAWGTSAPELVVSVQASLTGHPGVSVGNLVGSNIANFMLIGGICAVLMSLGLRRHNFWRDGSVLLLATLAFILLYIDGYSALWKGLVMMLMVLAYSVWMTLDMFKQGELPDELEEELLSWFSSVWRVVLGALLLAFGGHFLIQGAVSLANYLGVHEAVVGMTVVAVGTSLPELAASLAAIRRKQNDIVLGNLLGSNIYNILAIMGLVSLISGDMKMPVEVIQRDMWIMAGSTVAVLAVLLVLQRLPRWSGPLLLLGYVGFVAVQAQSL